MKTGLVERTPAQIEAGQVGSAQIEAGEVEVAEVEVLGEDVEPPELVEFFRRTAEDVDDMSAVEVHGFLVFSG